MMSDSAKRIEAPECNGVPPTWCVHAGRLRAPKWFETNSQFKGFGGGVPLNTETAAVKPRVGIYEITKRCLFYVDRIWARSHLMAEG